MKQIQCLPLTSKIQISNKIIYEGIAKMFVITIAIFNVKVPDVQMKDLTEMICSMLHLYGSLLSKIIINQ